MVRASPATCSTRRASPTEFDALTSTASPGCSIGQQRSRRLVDVLRRRSTATLPTSASASGAHFLADQDQPVDLRRRSRPGRAPAWSASLCAPSSRIGPSTAIRRSAPLFGAEAPAASRPSRPDWRCSFRRSAAASPPPTCETRCRSPRPLSPPMSASASPATATSAPSASTAASTASAFDTQCSPRCDTVKVSSRSSSDAVIRLPPCSARTAWIAHARRHRRRRR